jgi:hypothetical protein
MICARAGRTRPRLRSTSLAVTFVMLVACSIATQARRDAQLRHELDDARINQALTTVWPVALHLLAEHGFQLVGRDRLAVGAPSASPFKRFTGGGFETGRTDHGLVLETTSDASSVRYRAEGVDLGDETCRVTFIAIKRTGTSPSEERSRDLDLELELLRRLDPEQAKRIVQAASAVR